MYFDHATVVQRREKQPELDVYKYPAVTARAHNDEVRRTPNAFEEIRREPSDIDRLYRSSAPYRKRRVLHSRRAAARFGPQSIHSLFPGACRIRVRSALRSEGGKFFDGEGPSYIVTGEVSPLIGSFLTD